MSKAEDYIRKNTNQFSNEDGFDYIPWLTPDHARRVAEIAREEVVEKATNFIEMLTYGFTIKDDITKGVYTGEQLLEDFKKYMED